MLNEQSGFKAHCLEDKIQTDIFHLERSRFTFLPHLEGKASDRDFSLQQAH